MFSLSFFFAFDGRIVKYSKFISFRTHCINIRLIRKMSLNYLPKVVQILILTYNILFGIVYQQIRKISAHKQRNKIQHWRQQKNRCRSFRWSRVLQNRVFFKCYQKGEINSPQVYISTFVDWKRLNFSLFSKWKPYLRGVVNCSIRCLCKVDKSSNWPNRQQIIRMKTR